MIGFPKLTRHEDKIVAINTRKPIDMIVEQLEEHRANFNCRSCKQFYDEKERCSGDCTDALIDDLIEIVKAGGKE